MEWGVEKDPRQIEQVNEPGHFLKLLAAKCWEGSQPGTGSEEPRGASGGSSGVFRKLTSGRDSEGDRATRQVSRFGRVNLKTLEPSRNDRKSTA